MRNFFRLNNNESKFQEILIVRDDIGLASPIAFDSHPHDDRGKQTILRRFSSLDRRIKRQL